MATTTPPAPPATTEPTTETLPYECWRAVPLPIRRAVAREYAWRPDRHGQLSDAAGWCPAQRAGALLGLRCPAPWECGSPGGARYWLGGDRDDWARFMQDVDAGRIAPAGLAKALGVE